MVLTSSTMLPLGSKAPNFNLPDVVHGKRYSLADFSPEKNLLVMFICQHCPYVQHIKMELAQLGGDYAGKNVELVAISSNDAERYQDDAPAGLKAMADELQLSYPLLYDETQNVAKDFTAACTPDFFLFDKDRRLIYRGQLDDARPGNGKPVNGKDLRAALDAAIGGKQISGRQRASAGCNIKWKPGNEPDYFK